MVIDSFRLDLMMLFGLCNRIRDIPQVHHSLSFDESNLSFVGVAISRCYPWVYILPFRAKTVPAAVSKLMFQMS